jgi:GNAT superfamily N-acetyltransferase
VEGDRHGRDRVRPTFYNLKMPVTMRAATPDDVSEILAFIRALAAYERAPDAVIATEADLLRDGFGPNPYFFCLIAELDSRPAGYAFYFFDYSTWIGRPGLYLEDIYVHPQFRGRGIGKALLQRVAAIAVEKGCCRLKWEVLDWNTPAIDFYRAMGAEFPKEWLNVCVNGDALLRLAGAPDPAEDPTDNITDSRAPSFPPHLVERVGDRERQPLISSEAGE